MNPLFGKSDNNSSMAKTGLLWDDRYLLHKTGPNHPESPARLNAIINGLKERRIFEKLKPIKPRVATKEEILLAHSAQYFDIVEESERLNLSSLPTGDTPFSQDSLTVALLAVGGVLETCDQVMSKEITNAFCAIRPPGHHAMHEIGMGFCVFSNIAIAAKYLNTKHGLERILVVDWDVHHGNGTYDILKDDPSVFQFHIQQEGIFPGTGSREEIGEKKAKHQTINNPMPRGANGTRFMDTFKNELLPAMEQFKPQFIIISAGFDAHRDDTLGGLKLESQDYADMTMFLKSIADKYAEGRIVSVLEGGYNLPALSSSVSAHIKALLD